MNPVETKHQYVIVGAGLAGTSAAEGIRERDRTGSILVVGRETELPYDRPPLSKQLWFGKKTVEQIALHEQSWYAANGVDLLLGTSVVQLDVEKKEVVDDQGVRHGYEKLLLATGGIPRRLSIPGGELDGICYYRTLGDFQRVRAQATKGKSALVIGGGFIGSELAAALSHAGVTVTMLFPDPYLGRKVFPESLGSYLQKTYRDRGIRIMNGDQPTSIEDEGERFVTRTHSGAQISTDLVIAGIGITPSSDLAKSAGLTVENGVTVNELLQSTNPDVYVAGDLAFFPYAAFGRQMRVEHWDNAVTQGKQAGRNMAGAGEPYLHMPFFFSDLFEFGYEAVGEINTQLETIADWEDENKKGVIYYLADGKVRGVMMCNVWDKVDAARQIIRSGAKATPEHLRGLIRSGKSDDASVPAD